MIRSRQTRREFLKATAAVTATASLGATILEIPSGQITRAMGDVHPLGNPHYWLDPENGKRIAKEIADRCRRDGGKRQGGDL